MHLFKHSRKSKLLVKKNLIKVNKITIEQHSLDHCSDVTYITKTRYYCWASLLDECTFCITFSFKAEGYTESTLIHMGCPAVIFRLDNNLPVLWDFCLSCTMYYSSNIKQSFRNIMNCKKNQCNMCSTKNKTSIYMSKAELPDPL